MVKKKYKKFLYLKYITVICFNVFILNSLSCEEISNIMNKEEMLKYNKYKHHSIISMFPYPGSNPRFDEYCERVDEAEERISARLRREEKEKEEKEKEEKEKKDKEKEKEEKEKKDKEKEKD